jgi:hypothetical protein
MDILNAQEAPVHLSPNHRYEYNNFIIAFISMLHTTLARKFPVILLKIEDSLEATEKQAND